MEKSDSIMQGLRNSLESSNLFLQSCVNISMTVEAFTRLKLLCTKTTLHYQPLADEWLWLDPGASILLLGILPNGLDHPLCSSKLL